MIKENGCQRCKNWDSMKSTFFLLIFCFFLYSFIAIYAVYIYGENMCILSKDYVDKDQTPLKYMIHNIYSAGCLCFKQLNILIDHVSTVGKVVKRGYTPTEAYNEIKSAIF